MSTQEQHFAPLPEPLSHLAISEAPIIDSDGIPKSSDRSEPELIEGIDWEYGGCPYKSSPSRTPHGVPHEVPMSFLERDRLVTAYPQMMGVVAELRTAYCEDASIEGPLNTYQARLFIDGLTYLPIYLAFHGQKSISPNGDLPPALIVLSNSSAGALGALGAFEETNLMHPEKLLGTPSTEEMIEDSERRRTMIGAKTVCAASPVMMKRFINAVIHGDSAHKPTEEISVWDYIDRDEVPALIGFGQSMEFCRTAQVAIKARDEEAADTIRHHLQRGHSDRRIRQSMAKYLTDMGVIMRGVTAHQVHINACLQRQPISPPLSVEDYTELCGLEMPSIISRLTDSQIPSQTLAAERDNSHVTIALGTSIWKLMAQHDGLDVPDYVR